MAKAAIPLHPNLPSPMKPLDYLIAVTVPIVWGMGIVFAKPAVDQFPPILLMAFRFGVAALILVWFVPVPQRILLPLSLAAFVGATIQYGLTFNGLKLLDASTTALIVQAEVPFLALIAAVFLKEKLGPRKIIGMVVAFIGIYLITGEPRLRGQEVGIMLVLGGAATWAIGQILIRRLGEVGGLTLIAWVAVLATPQLFVTSALFETGQLQAIRDAGMTVWGTVAYLGVFMTAIGYGCWYHVLGRYEANRVAPFLLLTPVASVLGGWLLLGEPLTLHILAGGGIVTAGVAVLISEPWTKRARSLDQRPDAQI